MPDSVALANAERASLKAMSLDDSLAGVHGTTALVREYVHWDWSGSEREYRLAISLDGQAARFHAALGSLLVVLGKNDEALREGRVAVQLEPTSLGINAQLAESLYLARRYDDAIQQARNTLNMESSFFEAAETLAKALHQKGRDREAIEVLKRDSAPILDTSYPRALLVALYASSGNKDDAKSLLQTLQVKASRYWVSPCDIALATTGLDDPETAIRLLNQAYEEHDSNLIFLSAEPLYDSLRADPQFQDLVQKMRFP